MSTNEKRDYSCISLDSPIYRPDAFSRLDESDDAVFYQKDRFVSHLDETALQTVKHVIGSLVIESEPVILDLMAGWDSHIPDSINLKRLVALGLNQKELEANADATETVIYDLNKVPALPFPDDIFDAVVCTVSVDYMTQPLDVFKEVQRILKPGGVFIVIFSNRIFPEKAVKIWKESDENERSILVQEFFDVAGGFERPREFVSMGRPRPKDDKYVMTGIASDPVYAVFAEKQGGDPCRPRRKVLPLGYGEKISKEEMEIRKKRIKDTLQCPHCGESMKKWKVPENPFCYTWDNEFMYICFNDECPYYVKGWEHMYSQGNRGVSYRLMYNPEKDLCSPIPVPSPRALRDGIIVDNVAL
ncbi:MAG: methyltransferase domain-containing protein [Deltaproteobacteria bacterium]|nr:methyltransferase domain-containing protein [Deltaproteobacteria bacterium]